MNRTAREENIDRIEKAREVLALHTGDEAEIDDDQRARVVDLLTNLRHLCAEDGIDADAAWAISAVHYEAETE